MMRETQSERDADRIAGPGLSQQAWLEIRLGEGPSIRRPLLGACVVIGRVSGVEIQLDHDTVSRRHAEMFCDPFGRWWIRDLGSLNGTTVGGDVVLERILSPGDEIGIGDFKLVFAPSPGGDGRDPLDYALLDEGNPTVIRRVTDLEPPRIAASHLRSLLDHSRHLLAMPDPQQRIESLCELIVRPDFLGTMAIALRVGERSVTHLSPPMRAQRSPAQGRPYISGRVIDALREKRASVLASNVPNREVFPASVEISMAMDVMELTVIACPFRIVGDEMDVLYVHVPRSAGNAEWLNLFELAAQVYQQGETAWAARRHAEDHAAIERELATARTIQSGLVPTQPEVPGFDVAVGFEPCKWVGGDYVDVVPMPDGRVLFAVADVCGKGLQAALVGSSLHTMVRATVDTNPGVRELMERVNRHLCDWLPEHSFVTMVGATIDPATGEVDCVNAGHPPVLVLDGKGGLRQLQAAENPALGIGVLPLAVQRTRIAPGDVLVMYTDGLTELRDPAKEQMLGQERLGEELVRLAPSAARGGVAAVREGLAAMLRRFCGGERPEDDQTFLLVRRI
jgi:serine phosphatase RsbU (regulator of sigma subunit)